MKVFAALGWLTLVGIAVVFFHRRMDQRASIRGLFYFVSALVLIGILTFVRT